RVVSRPLGHAAMLEPLHRFARQLVRPRPRLARRLVRAVEVHHDAMPGRFAQDRLIAIDHLLAFVIEEVDLRAGDAEIAAFVEEGALFRRRGERPAVLPQPDADVALPRARDQLAQLRVGPALPDALDDVVFEPELAG